jgi:hypothetical protein
MFRRDDPLSHYQNVVVPFLSEFGAEALGPELTRAAAELSACVEALERTSDEWKRESLIDNYWVWWARLQAWLCEG